MNKKVTAKQQDILNAAEIEFQKHGLHNAVIDVIVERANVSKRTVYKYYRSKLDLFQAVLMQKYKSVPRAQAVKYDTERDLRVQLAELVEAEMNALQNPAYLDVAQIILRELMMSDDSAEKVFAQLPPTGTGIENWLQSAVNDGYLVASDVAFAAESLENHIKSYAFYPQIFGFKALGDLKRQQVVAYLCDIVLKGHDYTHG